MLWKWAICLIPTVAILTACTVWAFSRPKFLGKELSVDTNKNAKSCSGKVGIFAAWLAVASLIFAYPGWGKKLRSDPPTTIHIGGMVDITVPVEPQKTNDDNRIKIAQVFVLLTWTLLPPVWFWVEYFFFKLPELKLEADPDKRKSLFEDIKYRQDLSAKFWLALVSSLLVLYFWKDLHS